MGTSASYVTPTKGNWTSAKRAISSLAQGADPASVASKVLSNVASSFAAGHGGGDGGSGSGGTGGAGGLVSSSARSGVAQGAGFLTSALQSGTQTALQELGITDTEGLDGTEIVDRISEALVGGRFSLDQEIAIIALREALLEILGAEPESFDSALQSFISERGLRGFVERFLKQYVLERVWQHIADAARERLASESEVGALYDGLEQLCSFEVSSSVGHLASTQPFDQVDWFGSQGRNIADGIADGIERSLVELI